MKHCVKSHDSEHNKFRALFLLAFVVQFMMYKISNAPWKHALLFKRDAYSLEITTKIGCT